MNGSRSLYGLPYITFPGGSSLLDQVSILEQALITHPEDELKIIRFLVPLGSCVKEKHQLCLEMADRLHTLAEKEEDKMEAMLSKATILWQERIDPAKAEELFIEAYNMDAEYQQPYENLCDMYMERKEYAKALQWANLMIEVEGMEHIGLGLKGDALIALNLTEDAIKAFKQVIKMNDTDATAYYGLSKCYVLQNKYELARDASIAAFEKCHYPNAHYAYGAGYCYHQLDDPYRAIKWYSKALDIDPALPDALNNMAVVSLDLSNGWEEALPYLLKAVALSGEAINPSMRLVYRNLWAYYKQILDEEKAAYYQRLNYKCLGFDDDSIDFLDMFGNDDQ